MIEAHCLSFETWPNSGFNILDKKINKCKCNNFTESLSNCNCSIKVKFVNLYNNNNVNTRGIILLEKRKRKMMAHD